MEHVCTQEKTIRNLVDQTNRQNRALFGNSDDPNDLGAIELIKEIHKTQLEMIPTYNGLNNWRIFWEQGKQLGGLLVALIVSAGIIMGAIYAVKAWFKS
jgi:hypothetical protein